MELNFEESVYNNVLEGCQGNLVGQFEAAVRRSRRISLTLVRFAIAPREASPHEFSDSTTAHAFTNVEEMIRFGKYPSEEAVALLTR